MRYIPSGKARNKLCKAREIQCHECLEFVIKHIPPSSLNSGKPLFCSMKCSSAHRGRSMMKGEYRECQFCKKSFYSRRSYDRLGNVRKFCSRKCMIGIKKMDLPDGQYLSYDKYIVISKTPDGRKDIKMHRYLMEQHIGRRLLPSEIVHHINEIKTDNRLENLQIMTRTEHNKIHKFLEKGNKYFFQQKTKYNETIDTTPSPLQNQQWFG